MQSNINQQNSISQNIANILNSAPSGFGEDEEEFDGTSAKVSTNELSEKEYCDDIQQSTKIRIQNIDLLETVDQKYAGKISSRKNLRASSDESEEELEDTNKTSDNEDSTGSENEQRLEDENSEFDDNDHTDISDRGSDSEDISNFKHFRDTSTNQQGKKGICVRNQLKLWENLLEIRIQLQKCLGASNKMPTDEYFNKISKNGGKDFRNQITESKKSLENVLSKMIVLQELFLQKYPETKKILTKKFKSDEEVKRSDEEITSEEDTTIKSASPKKRKREDYEELLTERHELYKKYRNGVIQKWNDQTRIGVLSKNNSNSHTILNQIDHILQDKSKLMKKTQLKRSNYKILGEVENESEEVENYNENIYDDYDFYHQLLRELIEFKSSDVTDPVQLGRQWIQLQNMRSKMKRKIDTRATKGRKIRYAVHSKLVNFMAPIDYRSTWTEEAKKELFGSLFGKKQMS